MKRTVPSFEHLLSEIKDLFIRIEDHEGVRTLVAGGIGRQGVWLEYPVAMRREATLLEISQCLGRMVGMIQEENRQWQLEAPHHRLIREMSLRLN